jgi:imidazolonepropionase-like amidohydrolase
MKMKYLKLVTLFILALTISVSAQDKKEDTYILITNVSVWDGTSDKTIKADVLVENNLIKQVGQNIKAPRGATVIDGKGGMLTPGLIDMHTHIMLNGPKAFYTGQGDYDPYTIGAWAYRDMNILMDQGFTSIRDIAGNSLGIAKAKLNGVIEGPRIWSSGPAFSSTGGHGITNLI